ncbi:MULTISPECIES: hypothetical protein [unclassified Guyparkeria]|uniref:hypothetical protein n=1 Tax=unclassified Guyparkeria TaxID=2626246 RepID=UPI00073365BD|nr:MULTISPECIES: hypothetical protein [unclassified Guyparkeria]KTG15995.1 hypothetical protein AUR63_05975 [Guyparkeria sp. XI15]OAE84750.1 hypothetical protein AWR35_05985 [Guyparkeria sp. WRN-7]
MYDHLVYSGLISIAFLCLTYSDWAARNGWPVGHTLAKGDSWPKMISTVFMIYLLTGSFIHLQWWSPLAVIALGLLFSFLIMTIFKKWSQIIAVAGIIPAAVASIFLTDSVISAFL